MTSCFHKIKKWGQWKIFERNISLHIYKNTFFLLTDRNHVKAEANYLGIARPFVSSFLNIFCLREQDPWPPKRSLVASHHLVFLAAVNSPHEFPFLFFFLKIPPFPSERGGSLTLCISRCKVLSKKNPQETVNVCVCVCVCVHACVWACVSVCVALSPEGLRATDVKVILSSELSLALSFSSSLAYILPSLHFPLLVLFWHFSPLMCPLTPPSICVFLSFLHSSRIIPHSPALASLSFSFTLPFCLPVALFPPPPSSLFSFFYALHSLRPSISVCTWQSVFIALSGGWGRLISPIKAARNKKKGVADGDWG